MKDFSTSEIGGAKLQFSTDEHGTRDEAFCVSIPSWIVVTTRSLR